jgi:hypothetical protein
MLPPPAFFVWLLEERLQTCEQKEKRYFADAASVVRECSGSGPMAGEANR